MWEVGKHPYHCGWLMGFLMIPLKEEDDFLSPRLLLRSNHYPLDTYSCSNCLQTELLLINLLYSCYIDFSKTKNLITPLSCLQSLVTSLVLRMKCKALGMMG